MLNLLQDFTQSLAEPVQWLGVMLVSMIPFVESYLGSAVGVVAGVWAPLAILAAIVGNIVSMLIFVNVASGVRGEVAREKPESAKRAKLRRLFDRYGVPGVSLLGQTVLPSQITSAAMVSFGADRRAVIFWQCISIVLWGLVFGGLAAYGVSVLG